MKKFKVTMDDSGGGGIVFVMAERREDVARRLGVHPSQIRSIEEVKK